MHLFMKLRFRNIQGKLLQVAITQILTTFEVAQVLAWNIY